ncbi:MAG TPA: methyltransferase domain-containing protein [Pseudonocardiaceae bacterium]|nr:methyltransferase domain-containing protein [Pseudonocardiaceae bacterium]
MTLAIGPGALVADLDSRGLLPADWASVLGAVPRERFIPGRMWADEPETGYLPIDRGSEPDRWLDAVYSDRVIVTQFDDGATEWPNIGHRPTCSASMPSAVVGMLDVLDVRDGDHVLEIGTGTGYNAALLAARLGDDAVTSIEVDPVLADLARANLDPAGHKPTVVCDDGAAGWSSRAPYDRVIVTATVQLGRFPYAWVEQASPGAVIVVPVRTELASGPLVRFTVGEDGAATGRAVPMRVGFMELRAQRTPAAGLSELRWDDPAADVSYTEIEPWTTLLRDASQWAIAVAVPQCRHAVWKRTEQRRHGVAWLIDPLSRSWASVVPGDRKGQFVVRQSGPRRLWDETETAYRWWQANGEPPVEAWQFVIGADRQYVRLA